MSIKERLAIDVSNWQGKPSHQIHQDVASFVLEAGDRSLAQRVNPVVLDNSAFGGLIKENSLGAEDMATKRILRWAEKDTPATEIRTQSFPLSETEILDGLRSSVNLSPDTALIWISPPVEGQYREARLVVYQTIRVNNQKYLFFRAICSGHSAEECLDISQRLSPFIPPDENLILPTNIEQLTATPLPLSIPENQSLATFFSQFIDLPEVWQTIAEGKDLQEKISALEKTEAIVDSHYQSIGQASNFLDSWVVGTNLERALREKMNFALRSGPCGGLYSDLSSPSLSGIVGVEISAKNYLGISEGTRKFILNCGACGKELKMYMTKGDHCPHCHGVYEGC